MERWCRHAAQRHHARVALRGGNAPSTPRKGPTQAAWRRPRGGPEARARVRCSTARGRGRPTERQRVEREGGRGEGSVPVGSRAQCREHVGPPRPLHIKADEAEGGEGRGSPGDELRPTKKASDGNQ